MKNSKGSSTKNASNAASESGNNDEVPATEVAEDDEEEGDEEARLAKEKDAPEDTPQEIENLQASATRSKEEIAADEEARRTFPLVYNEFVESWIKYFTGRGRPVMQKWLARSTRYIPLMKQVLREEGLPEDLIYLSMIESGFSLKAKSRAKAVGPWQFMKATGNRYGLAVEYWIDERRDIRKSTYAAAQYLKELHQIFGSWYLAAASYNAGEGKTLMAVRRDRTRNFWELARKKKNYRAETRNYVPKIIAAALVSKNPEKYGFTNIPYENPLSWETIKVPSGVSLKQIASLIGEDEEILDILNAELRREITPPRTDGYELRVPRGKRDVLAANMDKLQSKKIGNFLEHTIRRGDTLGGIARKYGSDVETIRELNKLTSKSKLRIGQELMIPTGGSDDSPRNRRNARSSKSSTLTVAANTNSPSRSSTPTPSPARDTKPETTSDSHGSHVVQSGESLWSIAQKYGVSVNALKRANQGKNARSLKPGQSLKVPVSKVN